MLKNNNEAVINRMAGRSLRNNRSRTGILVVAVLLSAFMIFSVLTVGTTYFKMERIQNIRLNGAEFDAIMYGVTEEQQRMCEKNPDITETGILAVSGYVEETEADSTINVGLVWADDTYWNTMMEPVREKVEGEYPKQEDEVMVTKEALKECGLEDLQVGDSFTMTYGTFRSNDTKTFRISGMWEGFGTKKVFYVSKAFYDQSGYELSNVSSGRYLIRFKQKIMTQKEQDVFIESMNLGKQQNLFFMADLGNSAAILGGMIGMVCITCFCAYLLIYNVMYLSVAGNVRYYGLMQTIGMTGRQVYRLVQRQMMLIGMAGIVGGIVLGSSVSFLLIPAIVKIMGIRTKQAGQIEVAFHPAVFLLTVLVSGLTVYIAGRKPAKMATDISPIEALGYQTTAVKKKRRKTGKGYMTWRMAKQQITRDKKKFILVVLSLATSLSVFLCMVTLIESQGARTIVSNYMDMDLVIKNDTLKKEDHEKWKQILDEQLLAEIREKEGVQEVHPFFSVEVIVPWEPDFADAWMKEFYAMWMTIPYEEDMEEYKEHPENFGSFLVGIDEQEFDYLNTNLEKSVDEKEFLEGKTCILYRNGLDFQTEDLQGKQVTCAEYVNAGHRRSFEIAGLTDEQYYCGPMLGYPPTIIVSDSALKDFVPNPFVYKTSIRYQQEYDEEAEAVILDMMQESPYHKDFSYESKIDEMKYVKKAQGNMMEIGIGIILILAFIGILNYINTVTGNIQSRRIELAVLESVGMTERQMRRMLVSEGLLYAGGSVALTVTVGMGVTYYLFQTMNYRGITFAVPLLPLLAAIAVVTLVCVLVPLFVYQRLEKRGTIVERIRGVEL